MNEFLRSRRDCFVGIKAYQNIRASLSAFERLCTMEGSNDHFLISSFFYMGVIRYGKPFLKTATGLGNFSYPIKHLKDVPNFLMEVHKHLLMVRNTLVAHDDFKQIEPRLLIFSINLEGSNIQIPTSMLIANKCISHPSDLDGSRKIKNHVEGTLLGVTKKLLADINKLRSISIENPEQAKEAVKYSKNYGKVQIPKGGTDLKPPECVNDEWLDPMEPDFSEIHHGFNYEKIVFKQNFYGPEKIKLPNGNTIEITPTKNTKST